MQDWSTREKILGLPSSDFAMAISDAETRVKNKVLHCLFKVPGS
jgi:hypothetical protein